MGIEIQLNGKIKLKKRRTKNQNAIFFQKIFKIEYYSLGGL